MSQRSVSGVSMSGVEQYIHSAVHYAIINHDYEALKQALAKLPTLPKAGQVVTEEESIVAEEKADAVSAVIDRRDVPGRETPLHLAVRLGDAKAVEMLMAAGADWSLQNEQGWSALQEAVCAREEGIAMIITRYYQPMAWAKWCRRLPRITGAMQRMRNFYMEITFNFESSVIPFIGRIAPSDTYRIWKQGSNLRADMTLAGFDGFKIQRADQSFLFLGDGTEDGKVSPGSLLVLTHKDKEVTNALEGAGAQPSEAEIAQEVAIMSQTNMYRPGIDVTEAELVPQLSWRRQEKTEMIGSWKAKVFDMHHVQISVRSRRVPGAMTDEELFAAETEAQADHEDGYADLLTEEEMQQLENVLSMDSMDLCDDSIDESRPGNHVGIPDSVDHGCNSVNGVTSELSDSDRFGAVQPTGSIREHKKGWFRWGKKTAKQEVANGGLAGNGGSEKSDASLSIHNGSLEKSQKQNATQISETNRLSVGTKMVADNADGAKRKVNRESSSSHRQTASSNGNLESEYKKGLRPVLWLTPDFPLKTEEVLPLLDILANKVKAVRRLRELLTTKLPAGTFPVKVAIPIIPTIRVVVTFNKFEELSNEEFCTPPSSPLQFSDGKGKEQSSWFTWIRGSRGNVGSSSLQEDFVEEMDPFLIPSDYTWIDMKEKKRRLKAKKAKNKKGKRISSKPSGTMAKSENDV